MATDPTQPQQTTQSPFDVGDTSGPWALEETLKKVLNVLQKDLTNSNKEVKTIDTLNRNIDRLIQTVARGDANEADANRRMISIDEQQRKALKDAERIARQNARSQEEIAKNTKQSKEAARQALLGGGPAGGGNRGGGALGMAKAVVQKTWNGISQAGQAIMQSGGDITAATQGVAAAIPALGGILGASVGMVQQTQNYMESMGKVGQSFNGNMVKFSQTAAKAGLSMEQTARIMVDNSDTIAKIGTDSFFNLQRQVRSSTEKFGRFGLSLDDQAKVISNFYEIQMSLGRRQNAVSQKAIVDYTAKLTVLSKLTGKSVDELMAQQRAAADSADRFVASQRIYERYGKKQSDNFDKVFDATARLPESVQKSAQELLSSFGDTGSIANTQLGGIIASMGKSDEAIRLLRQSLETGDDQAFNKFLYELSQQTGNKDSAEAKLLGSLAQGSDAFAQGARQWAGDSIQIGKMNKDAFGDLDAQAEAAKKAAEGSDLAKVTQAQTEMQEKLGKAQTELLSASLDLYPGLMGLAAAAADATTALLKSDAVSTAIDKFSAALAKAPEELGRMFAAMHGLEAVDGVIAGLITTIADFGAMIGRVTGLGEGLGSALALLGGAALVMNPKAAINAVKSMGGKGAAGAAAGAGEGAAAGAAGAAGAGLKGLAGAAGKSLLRGGIVGAGIESLGYIFGDKQLTGKNLAKSALTVGGGALGGLVGSALGPLGTIVGGGVGAAGGQKLADWLLGPDDVAKPEEIKKSADAQAAAQNQNNKTSASNEQSRHKTKVSNQTETHKAAMTTAKAELAQMQNFYQYRIKMEKILADQQVKLATIRNNYEMKLLNQKYNFEKSKSEKGTGNNKTGFTKPIENADAAFKNQVAQAISTRKEIDQYQAKAAKMNALGQTGVIVQPSIGNDIGSKQLQEMKLTNQFLYNIYDNQRGNRKFKPLVAIYQPGL